jgi:drug/metabolite transporter (DMT)-like permease
MFVALKRLLYAGRISARSSKAWLVLGFSGVLSTGVAHVFWNLGIRHVGPSHKAAFANLVPLVAFLTGMIWLAESGTT